MSAFVLPDLGEGLQEAEIVSWHVAAGDHVVIDQPLVAVETEKAVVEIPSPRAGHVGKLLATVGERVAVGAPLLEFEEGPHPETGAIVGELPKPTIPSRQPVAPAAPAGAGPVRAAPAVRAQARELGVDLGQIRPSGPGGTITLSDIHAAAPTAVRLANALHGARRTMATRMAQAWREVVHATIHDEADIAAWTDAEDLTCRLVRALVAGCKAEPGLNASYDGASFSLRENAAVHIALAIDSPAGLFAPVLRAAGQGTPQQWRQQIDALKRAVHDRSLKPSDLQGATISLSNFGSIAGRHAALIVVPPQVAILGVGRAGSRPVAAENGSLHLHRALPLSLTFDHRAVTGGMTARFLRAVIDDLETAT